VSTQGKKAGRAEQSVSVKLKLKVVPGASQSGISGWLGEMLKVRVSAPPEKGKANAAVEALVARALDLPAGSARIISGAGSQQKVIEICGLSEAEILEKLGTIVA
jgi:uncharacterized protein YggU (UPF0235/DUF167 family)